MLLSGIAAIYGVLCCLTVCFMTYLCFFCVDVTLCRLRSAETVTASLPLALGLTNKDERWINFNFNSVSRMCKSDDDIS